MQYIHDFKISIKTYCENNIHNDYPEFNICPMCKAHVNLEKKGFYKRYAITLHNIYQIKIRRYYCPCCKKTLSILPSFLLPRYQYSLEVIMECLEILILNKKQHVPFYRQLMFFYKKRFLKNLPKYIAFFRDFKKEEVFSSNKKEKAIKLFKMISSFPKENFAKKFYDHFQTNFMAI
ncbi:DUF6431 domain-containing protein [Anaerobranca gottschalkii]|uniref:DUF6431 domain-containing protein n=1 Tax=Anaerobranca gottschalkii DSM 13577 TaxID=1120990 RepID=A0A1H9YR29_9FIRM|nr:DUF6431 domain-containing protein [Anaerobranca gottschalkii]SES71539.1 hypothetical protein SAMN03080614_100482 [Anaerobranca gottschalkii DSM 13577]